ncbi:MAG: hypothetical protein V1790_11810 [Planctomycetota bacterium]
MMNKDLPQRLFARQSSYSLITLLFMVSVIAATRITCSRKPSDSNLGARRISPDGVGTVLRIEGDVPDEIGKPEQICKARIDWERNSEDFILVLGKDLQEVELRNVIPRDQILLIQFTVPTDREPGVKFTEGEWFDHVRPKLLTDSPHLNTFRIRLSRFRRWDDPRIRTLAPSG